MIAEPTIQELIDAFRRGIRVNSDELADVRSGSVYEYVGGTAAILWSREAQRDTDLFAACKFNTMSGDDLTIMGSKRYGIDRFVDTAGIGTATVSRPSAGTAGTFWEGTRILAHGALAQQAYYEVAADTHVGAAATQVSIPIRAVALGVGTAIRTNSARFDDPIWDSSWTVSQIICAEGTDFESADQYRSRVRALRKDRRKGYRTSIVKACADVGASHVALFASDYGGDANDRGLNVCYVGGNGYTSDDTLVRKCTVALDSVRIQGDNLQVLQTLPVRLTIDLSVTLYNPARNYDRTKLIRLVQDSIVQYIGQDGAWGYRLPRMAGAIYRNIPQTQSVVFNSPTTDATVLQPILGQLNFPSALPRYFLRADDITVNLV